MKYPQFIKQNDKLAFVAPSYGCTIEPYVTRIKKSYEVLSNLGFQVEYGPNVFHEVIGRSNTPKKCAKEINDYFKDPDAKALLSVGGGELMIEILPFIDFELIKQNPKWFMGYSDNTNLTFLLPTICDVASIYGPCAPTFGITPWHDYVTDSYNLLTGKTHIVRSYGMWQKDENRSLDALGGLNLTEETKMRGYPSESLKFEGRLLGGCLDCLVAYLGTPMDHVHEFLEKYQADGVIWFLEACDLNTMSVRRTLYQLDLAGWFKYAKGFIFGRPLMAMESMAGLDNYHAIMGILKKYNLPIIFDTDLGHLPPSMPIITGSYGKVKYENNQLEIEMELK